MVIGAVELLQASKPRELPYEPEPDEIHDLLPSDGLDPWSNQRHQSRRHPLVDVAAVRSQDRLARPLPSEDSIDQICSQVPYSQTSDYL